MKKFFSIAFLTIASFAYTAEDPYVKHRINLKPELHPLTQEIIKYGIKRYGMQLLDAKQQDAEKKAAAHNSYDGYRDSDGEVGCSRMVPTWRLKIRFYPADKESEPLTRMVYEAVDAVKEADEAKTEDGDMISGLLSKPYLHGRTIYTIENYGIIKCSIAMHGYPYMWAKEYSQNDTQ